jgi:hypothetical protein
VSQTTVKFKNEPMAFYIFRTTIDVSDTGCKTLQNQTYKVILGFATEKISNYYAPFANSDPTTWQEILNVLPTSYVSF